MDLVEGAECELFVPDVSIHWGMWGGPGSRVMGDASHGISESLSSTSLVVDRIHAREAVHF